MPENISVPWAAAPSFLLLLWPSQVGYCIDGLVHEKRSNSNASAMQLRLSCTNPSISPGWEIRCTSTHVQYCKWGGVVARGDNFFLC